MVVCGAFLSRLNPGQFGPDRSVRIRSEDMRNVLGERLQHVQLALDAQLAWEA